MSELTRTNLRLFRLLVRMLGEKGIFTEKEYDRIISNMSDESEFEDTIQALEEVLFEIENKS